MASEKYSDSTSTLVGLSEPKAETGDFEAAPPLASPAPDVISDEHIRDPIACFNPSADPTLRLLSPPSRLS
jgi:hypothetical protein